MDSRLTLYGWRGGELCLSLPRVTRGGRIISRASERRIELSDARALITARRATFSFPRFFVSSRPLVARARIIYRYPCRRVYSVFFGASKFCGGDTYRPRTNFCLSAFPTFATRAIQTRRDRGVGISICALGVHVLSRACLF